MHTTTYDTTGWQQMEINLIKATLATLFYNANVTYTSLEVVDGVATCDVAIPFTASDVLTNVKSHLAALAIATAAEAAAAEALKNLTLQQLKDMIASAQSVDEILKLTASQ